MIPSEKSYLKPISMIWIKYQTYYLLEELNSLELVEGNQNISCL